jgi:Spy/CpxP family protein refolding chaperone
MNKENYAMNVKLISMVIALALPLSVMAYPGGGKGDYEQYRAKKIERLNNELGLSEDQKAKVEALFKEQGEKHRALHTDTQSQLQTILTPEQNTRLEEMKQRRQEKWREKHQQRKQEKSESSGY